MPRRAAVLSRRRRGNLARHLQPDHHALDLRLLRRRQFLHQFDDLAGVFGLIDVLAFLQVVHPLSSVPLLQKFTSETVYLIGSKYCGRCFMSSSFLRFSRVAAAFAA